MDRDISPIDYAESRSESEVYIPGKYTYLLLLSRHLTLRATIRLDPEILTSRIFIASPSLVDSRADHKRSILEISVEFCLIAINF